MPDLTLQPMVHVEDVAAAVGFYRALGADVVFASADGDFAVLQVGGSQLSLLGHPPNPEQDEGAVELNFEATSNLEQIEADLRAAGVRIVQPTTGQGFGRQLQIASPDGLLVKINEIRPGT